MSLPSALLALAQLFAAGIPPVSERPGAPPKQAAPPRIDARIRVDGVLDEPVWQQAARLGEFSQYSPSDGRPAEQKTEVLVWYSPTAIHFGVRAEAVPGSVRAHLTDRDRILLDDYIELQLGTFDDRRSAFVFIVNPFGIQADGALLEGVQAKSMLSADNASGREQADLSPDYTFDSKGRVTETGYELEIRIPFHALRYQQRDPQSWSIQIIRRSAASGREDTWAPARRDAASFLGQHGQLVGLTGLHRGLVLELNPVVTSTVSGAPTATGWDYSGGRPDFGGNLRWGLTTNITLNATANPDFSQVESDAGQVTPDPRRAVFFAEKRPFFLDGLEFFTTPSQVIYTRRIADPIAAAKVTGKIANTSFGLLSAVDGAETSLSGRDHPTYNVFRVLRNVGPESRIGFAYTDRIETGDYNRVGEVDGRLLFGGIYNLSFFGALSGTRQNGASATAPMWFASLGRTGRKLGFQATFQAISDRFEAGSGFVAQGDLASVSLGPTFTFYGQRDALVERFTTSFTSTWTWSYTGFRDGLASRDRQYWFGASSALRGGWQVGATLFVESFGYDERLFRDYAIAVPGPAGSGRVDTVAFGVKDRLPSLSFLVRVKSPELVGFSVDGFLAYGRDVNYPEWAHSKVVFSNVGLTYRPTSKLRFEGSVPILVHYRWTDGTRVDGAILPRLKVEYQLSRAIFFRVIGEYRSIYQDDLRDEDRTGDPILIKDPTDGIYKRELALRQEHNSFRVDWLFSFKPTPGTVVFAGYGSSLEEPRAFRFRDLTRVSDGFFTKFSYLFRL